MIDECSELTHEQWEFIKEELNFSTCHKLVTFSANSETEVLLQGFDKTYIYIEDED